MEKTKRVYPAQTNSNRAFSGLLLALALIIFFTGVSDKQKTTRFLLEQLPEQTAIPMNEAFDETPADTLIELPEYSWFALQTGAFENEEAARQSALAFQKRGAAGFLWKDGRFRVLAAVYASQEDARYVRQQLQDQHQIDSYLYKVSFPAVSLRVKGMKGQTDILKAALIHVHELASNLQRLSVEMDRQECNPVESVEQIKALRTQIDIVALRLRQRFLSPVPQTVKALLACFEDFGTFADELTGIESAAALGTKLKYQTFASLWKIQEIYQTLNHT